MTTTVGMLLDDVHTRAWDLCAELEDRRAENRYGERGLEVLAVWPRLATAALRVLDAVPLEPAWLDDMGSVRLVLGQVGRGVLEATADNGSAAASLKPDPAVGELALRLGLIADLLVGEKPARTDVDRAALEGLQANVVSIVHAVATVSLPLLQGYRVSPHRQAVTPPLEGTLFVTTRGNAYQRATVEGYFQRIRVATGISWEGEPPCLVDLRHTFATRQMIRAYTTDAGNPAATLGLLALWLGHSDPSHTYWYVQAVPELLTLAAHRVDTTTTTE